MFCPPVAPRGFSFRLFAASPEPDAVFSQHGKLGERVYLCQELEQAWLHSGCKGVCQTEWRVEGRKEALRVRP